MQIIKKINNNVALGIDDNNRELIVFGIGIGFPQTPYNLEDLSKIKRTYYNISNYYLNLLAEISEDVFNVSEEIVDFARLHIGNDLNSNIVFSLADHIQFTIERNKSGQTYKMPFDQDIRFLYENEMNIGKYAVRLINKRLNVYLDNDESFSIALHFINAENMINSENKLSDSHMIEEVVGIIERHLNINIDKNSFNYSRFVTHLQYLLKRVQNGVQIKSENKQIFETVKDNYPSIYKCVEIIKKFIEDSFAIDLNDEECLYLMLHVNRLYTREEKGNIQLI